MYITDDILAAGFGYLLGSAPFGLLLTRLAGLGDIRKMGSGNIGATNVLRTGRRDIAALTLLLDGGKAALALLIIRLLFDEQAALIAGGAALIGHCFPVWLKFNGGKGVATFLGALLAAFWPIGIAACATWLAIAYVFRYSSLAALVAAALAPLGAAAAQRLDVAALALVLALVVFWRHRANIQRLRAGTEPKIGQKPSKSSEDPTPAPPAA
ncbi:MAG TPA: acyl-phosphate glycerol 3-phosphate acyltransferase [Hyphomonadaceae bacterium]|nr:acyl-phosphate glycerol 3-phosphate acyltransferase [Hyphomonadaceae bacterium]